MTISGGRTEQLVISAIFLPRHWLYEWLSPFRSCGTYSVLSWSPSISLLCAVPQVVDKAQHYWPSTRPTGDISSFFFSALATQRSAYIFETTKCVLRRLIQIHLKNGH